MIKSVKELASELAKREGKKSQARIGDIRELIGILGEILFEMEHEDVKSMTKLLDEIIGNGEKRVLNKFKKQQKERAN